MNKVAHAYRELIAALTERLYQGERDIEALLSAAQQQMARRGELDAHQQTQVLQALRRDLEEFARSYHESQSDAPGDSVFARVMRDSLWKELADITDRSQLEWREVFQDLQHHGVYQSGEVVGLGNLVCEQCGFSREIYTPETLGRCPECGHDRFSRQPFTP